MKKSVIAMLLCVLMLASLFPIEAIAAELDDGAEAYNETFTPPEEEVTVEPAEEPVFVEAPAVEEPVIEQPVIEEPIVEEPVTEEPVTEEPVVEEPAIEEPLSEDETGENEASDTEETPCTVVFRCEPETAEITVYSQQEIERAEREQEEPQPIAPEVDKSYLLWAGEYVYSAEAEGYETVEKEPFTVLPTAERENDRKEIEVRLTKLEEIATAEEQAEPATGNNTEAEKTEADETAIEETETEETETAENPQPVRVEFVCEPKETIVTVYNPSILDENGDPTVIESEEDGSWMLQPGSYLYTASCDRNEILETKEIEIEGGNATEFVYVLIGSISEENQDAYNASASNSALLNINWDHIKSVGHQVVDGPCACYALAYCRTILDGQVHVWTEYQASPEAYDVGWWKGSYDGFFPGSKTAIYERMYSEISKGKPVVVKVNGSPQHYVAVVGYENVDSTDALSNSNFLIIDPAGSSFSAVNMKNAGYDILYQSNCYQLEYDTSGKTVGIASQGQAMTTGAGRTIPDGDYIIAAFRNPQYYMDIPGTSVPAASGTTVLLTGPIESVVQACDVWTVSYIDDGGFYTIKQKDTNISLDVYQASLSDGADIQVHTANSGNNQKWSISKNSDGSYRIQAKSSGFSLDIHSGDITNGTNITQWSNNDTNAQKWKFIPYEPDPPEEQNPAKTIVSTATGNKYERYDISVTWLEAKNFCENKGGHLVTILDANEQNLVASLLSECTKYVYYIGLSDEAEEGVWKWITGETYSYSNWDTDTPEPNGGAQENYGAIVGKEIPASKQVGEWLDTNNANDYSYYAVPYCGFICEYERQAYTVTYDANGGSGAPSAQTKTHDVTLTLSSTIPTHDVDRIGFIRVLFDANDGSGSQTDLIVDDSYHYTFKSWNTRADGSGTNYNPGASYTDNASATLYAQWESSPTTITLPTPTRDGYSFEGWATDPSATSGMKGSYTPPMDVTLYAIWKANAVSAGTITVGTVQGRPGSEVTVDLTLDKNLGIMMLLFLVEYDHSKLEFLGGEDGSLTGWTFGTEGSRALWDGEKDYTAAGVIAKLRFKITDSATDGDVTVSLSAMEAGNQNEQEINFTSNAGTVKIVSRLPGDCNSDGKVNGMDLVRLRRYLVGDNVKIDLSNADVTGDGKVTGMDLVRLRRYLVGDNVVLK